MDLINSLLENNHQFLNKDEINDIYHKEKSPLLKKKAQSSLSSQKSLNQPTLSSISSISVNKEMLKDLNNLNSKKNDQFEKIFPNGFDK